MQNNLASQIWFLKVIVSGFEQNLLVTHYLVHNEIEICNDLFALIFRIKFLFTEVVFESRKLVALARKILHSDAITLGMHLISYFTAKYESKIVVIFSFLLSTCGGILVSYYLQ